MAEIEETAAHVERLASRAGFGSERSRDGRGRTVTVSSPRTGEGLFSVALEPRPGGTLAVLLRDEERIVDDAPAAPGARKGDATRSLWVRDGDRTSRDELTRAVQGELRRHARHLAPDTERLCERLRSLIETDPDEASSTLAALLGSRMEAHEIEELVTALDDASFERRRT